MDFFDSPTEAVFRAELRTWLAAHRPAPLPPPTNDTDSDARIAALEDWHRELAAAGYVGLTFPVEFGGRGMAPTLEAIFNDEVGFGGYPPPPAIHHITNAIRLFGTDEQKAAYLPGMLSCTVRWCQGFSEPGAGSDLSSIRTKAERTTNAAGEEVYRIEGQKIWTSEAIWSQWLMLLCRTEMDRPAHRGLSMLLVPLYGADGAPTPGIDARPIATASGTKEFAEVFFDGAEVPVANLLGEPGQGWAIAMQLLGYERGPGDMGWVARLMRMLARLEDDVRGGAIDATDDDRAQIARAWVSMQALQLHISRTLSSRLDGSTPGPEGSVDKLLVTEADQLLNHVVLDVRGAASLIDEDETLDAYFWSRGQSIFGGTQQIQRNIVAQRVLGLPR
jgi:alkylation response protein AidB-like acyl-CoA dehydrogenase